MLRRILLSTVLVAAAGSAMAADLPYRTAAPAPYVSAAPIFTWTGFYAGLNAGGAWNENRGLSSAGFIAPNPVIFGNGNSDDVGFTGGAQIGYNMQFGSFVAGVEADINYLDRNGGGNGAFPAIAGGAPDFTDFAVGGGNRGNWFGTVRGRLGFAFDRALIYGTGGLAYGARSGSASITQRDYDSVAGIATLTNLPGTGGNGSNVGWALGAGMEYAFTNSMSFKIEYLHVDLGSNSRTFVAGPGFGGVAGGETITVRNENKFDVVRAGVNFRF
ncbi:MAG: outer membrane beta-barrel protein [Beijerinckiaceae bacterium]|nr:outer membrane beta-barrel protein [Beijerinckiaceae bacterium]